MRHLDPDEILRGVHGAPDDASRERIHHHIAACAECRRLMAEAVTSVAPAPGAAAAPPAWPTVPFEHYELADEVGRGGLGRVVRARHVPLGRTVAIKELLRA